MKSIYNLHNNELAQYYKSLLIDSLKKNIQQAKQIDELTRQLTK